MGPEQTQLENYTRACDALDFRGARGPSVMMMMSTAAFFSFFFSPLAVFPASTVATRRGCLELGSKAKVQGFFIFCFAQCKEKEAKGYVWPGCV